LPGVVAKPPNDLGDLRIGIDDNQTRELVATEGLKEKPTGNF
jgi:hypothetical protein